MIGPTRMQRNLLGLAGLLLVTACSDEPTMGSEVTVEILSWWSSKSERAALDALLDVHAEHYPDVRVINAAEDNAEEARARLPDRLRRGLPPDTFQANIGQDLFQWVLFDGRNDERSTVSSLDDIAREENWFDVFPPSVVSALSYEDRLYGVPVNIHRLNTLFYNRPILEREDLDPPATLEEFHATLATLVERGYEHPLSIGNEDDWTMSLFAMENLFPAIAGAEFYASYWEGDEEPEHELMQETLAQLLAMWPYFNDDAMEASWTDGVERLFAEERTDQAVFTVMGDWAKGHLQAEGYVAGEDFDWVPFPGSKDTFVFTSDCFPMPLGAPHPVEVTDLLVTFGSRRAQLAFNQYKGSLPARTDIEPADDLDALTRRTWDDFQSDDVAVVVALSGVLDTDFAEALAVAVRETLLDDDPDPVLFALRNNL